MKKLLRHSSQILHNRFPHNLCIDLGGRDIPMSQEFLNGRYTHSLVYQKGGIGVPGRMEGYPFHHVFLKKVTQGIGFRMMHYLTFLPVLLFWHQIDVRINKLFSCQDKFPPSSKLALCIQVITSIKDRTITYFPISFLIYSLKEDYPEAKVVGHRDLPGVKKDCPCFEL